MILNEVIHLCLWAGALGIGLYVFGCALIKLHFRIRKRRRNIT